MQRAESSRLVNFPVKEPEKIRPDFSKGNDQFLNQPLGDTLDRGSNMSFDDVEDESQLDLLVATTSPIAGMTKGGDSIVDKKTNVSSV